MEILMEKFLIIQTAFIGDAVLTLPMIQKLKELNPESLIDVIAIPSTTEIFGLSPAVNHVHVFDKRGKHKNLFRLYKFAEFIKQNKYTRIYAPHRSLRTSILVMLSGVRETYGFNVNSLPHIYKYLAEYEKASHEVERNLSLIRYPVEEDNWKILPKVKIPPAAERKVDDYLGEFGTKEGFTAVAPGSVWNTKIYPPEYMEQIIRYLSKEYGQVFIIGGESDKEICSGFADSIQGNVKSTAGDFNFAESIALLRRAKILISNDSAPAHLGMCADIPVLMLYCSTVPDFGFYPYNKKSYFLSFNDLFCKPCGIHGFDECPLGSFACGYNLKPETVIQRIKEMMND